MRKLTKDAQSLIEYSTIATLVMVGILLMGPYVIRSINAFFKDIEDDVQDSISEEIGQGNPDDYNLPGCDCTWGPQTCGRVDYGCNERQRLWGLSCTPPGCEDMYDNGGVPLVMHECRWDNECCTDWDFLMPLVCGVNAGLLPGWTLRRPDGLLGCPDGEGAQFRECGRAPIREYRCEPHDECVFHCRGTIDTYATLCPGDDVALTESLFYDHVGLDWDCSVDPPVPTPQCTDGRKCEAYCKRSWVPVPAANPGDPSPGCKCPDHASDYYGGVPDGFCECNPGWVSSLCCPQEPVAQCYVGNCTGYECTIRLRP